MQNKILFLLAILFPFELTVPDFTQLIVWNVGQGQWVTYSTFTTCKHFDVGGEFWNPQNLRNYCYKKENHLYISHEDQDHISFGFKVASILPKICFEAKPITQKKKFTRSLITKYLDCKNETEVKQINHSTNYKTTNDASQVFTLKNILIPGDSSRAMEKYWAYNTNPNTKYLVLGHHGSYTSTSDLLLTQLPKLKMAIASARFARYGHPHFETIERLKRYHIPILKTEDWGNIHIVLRQY